MLDAFEKIRAELWDKARGDVVGLRSLSTGDVYAIICERKEYGYVYYDCRVWTTTPEGVIRTQDIGKFPGSVEVRVGRGGEAAVAWSSGGDGRYPGEVDDMRAMLSEAELVALEHNRTVVA